MSSSTDCNGSGMKLRTVRSQCRLLLAQTLVNATASGIHTAQRLHNVSSQSSPTIPQKRILLSEFLLYMLLHFLTILIVSCGVKPFLWPVHAYFIKQYFFSLAVKCITLTKDGMRIAILTITYLLLMYAYM